jgi:hypothetical protein
MWRSGAPQRRGARGAFRGADAHTRCYAKLRRGIVNPNSKGCEIYTGGSS